MRTLLTVCLMGTVGLFAASGLAHSEPGRLRQLRPEESKTIRGTIHAHVQNGVDGSVWRLKTSDNKEYDLLLSIPNLGREQSKGIRRVAVGVVVEVTGVTFRLGDGPERITAKTLKILSIRGTIQKRVKNGVDGSVWLLKTDDNKEYHLLLSIPNLGREHSKGIRRVAEGVVVQVTGETFRLGDGPERITAKTLKILSIRGTIRKHIKNGVDGSVWLLRTSDGKEYQLLLSIPNLGREHSKGIRRVAVGVDVEVTGEIFRLGDGPERITAKTLRIHTARGGSEKTHRTENTESHRT